MCSGPKTWAYPQICILHFCAIFFILLTLNPHNFGQSGQNVIFFPITKPLRWGLQEETSFYRFDVFRPRSRLYRVATVTKIALLILYDSISWARKVKMRQKVILMMWTMQGRMVRKTLWRLRFMGNLCPFGLFWLCFQPRMPTKQLDWVQLVWGRVKGQAGLTCGQDDPPVLVDSNSRLCGRGASWQGKLHFRETSALQKLFQQCSWALWMLAHLSGWPPILIDSNSRLCWQGSSWQGRW